MENNNGKDHEMSNLPVTQKPDLQGRLPSPYLRYSNPRQDEEVHLREYLRVILKRKWIVLSFSLSVIITVLVLTLMTTPLYRSTVTIRFDKEGQSAFSVPGFRMEKQDAEYYVTQQEILKSVTLAEKVIRENGLDKEKDFVSGKGGLSRIVDTAVYPVNSALSYVLSVFTPAHAPTIRPKDVKGNDVHESEREIPLSLIYSLIGRLEVVPIKNSQLVEVSFISHKPDIAMNVANAVARAYIEYDLESRIGSTKQAKDFLTNQIEIAKRKLEDSERRLSEYASQHEVVFVDSEKQGIPSQKLSEITAALSAATNERMQKETLLREVQESGTENPVILGNPIIQELKRQQVTLESEYSNLSRTYKADYPKMQNLKRQIDSIYKKIEREKLIIVKSLESDYKASVRKEETFKRAFEGQQKGLLDFQKKAIAYNVLKREADVNKELLNGLLQKLSEAGVAAMSRATSIQVVDYARYPSAPYKPNKTQNFLLSIIFGLIGGVGLAFSVEYFDNTIKDVRDIEEQVNVPTLGMIPLQERPGSSPSLMIEQSKSSTAFSEAFRSIGVLLLSSTVKSPRTILVTSPTEKEGKTTVCISTAVALAESLGNGIIIDADLRKPKLHHIFKLDNDTGLATFLSGRTGFNGIDGKLIKPTHIKGLNIMTAGPVPLNPSELLLSAMTKNLMEILPAEFNFAIFDSAPLMGIPDSIYLSKVVDGSILVVRGGNTSKDALVEATKIFSAVDAKILGVVLNGAREGDMRHSHYSYYSSYFKDNA